MNYYPVENGWMYVFVAFILNTLAMYVWQYRRSPGAVGLSCHLMNRAVWLLCIMFIGTADNYATGFFWIKVLQVPANLGALLCLVFILQISGQGAWLTWRRMALLLVVPVVVWLLVFTNEYHGWYWVSHWPDGNAYRGVRGPACWLAIAYSLLLSAAVLYIGCRWIYRCNGLRRWQAATILLAPVANLIGNIIWLSNQHQGLFPPVLIGSLVTAAIWTYGFFYLRALNVLPLAQAAAIEIMGNCLAVVDKDGWVVDLNAAAAATLGITPVEAVGKHGKEIFAYWPALSEVFQAEEVQSAELVLEKISGRQYYELHVITLPDRRGRLQGKAFVWKDISAQKQAQQQLMEQEKALSILAERQRIGREIHDGRGQLGGYLQMELQTIAAWLDKRQPEKAKAQIERLRAIAKEFNTDVRETIAGLKIGAAGEQDFFVMLQEYLAKYQQNYGIAASLVADQPQLPLNMNAKLQLLRIIQEAMSNVRKHAKARQVTVHIDTAGSELCVRVTDDGTGFEPAAVSAGKNHYGLVIMQERAKEAGGQLRIESQPGAGTSVVITFAC